MRNAWLVACREFAENVHTKGFWLGIAMVPLLLVLGFSAQRLLESSTPSRAFVVVDPADVYGDAIDAAVERLHQREVLKAFGEYFSRHAVRGKTVPAADLEATPAVDVEKVLQEFSDTNPAALEAFVNAGGLAVAMAKVNGLIAPDAPPFVQPRKLFVRVDLPAGIDPEAGPAAVADALRPWLRGEQKVEIDGRPTDLFAAVIVPEDIAGHVSRPGGVPRVPEPGESVQYWAAN
ncbi:MAG: hypothetical protein FJ275_10590, partial [Planctomycetes bacterium]|nr:hypothetical protein [Planctomycetota bacterium]